MNSKEFSIENPRTSRPVIVNKSDLIDMPGDTLNTDVKLLRKRRDASKTRRGPSKYSRLSEDIYPRVQPLH